MPRPSTHVHHITPADYYNHRHDTPHYIYVAHHDHEHYHDDYYHNHHHYHHIAAHYDDFTPNFDNIDAALKHEYYHDYLDFTAARNEHHDNVPHDYYDTHY